MSAIASLTPKPTVADEIRARVVDDLREALKLAEAGEVAESIVIVRRLDGTWSHYWSGSVDVPEMIGRLEVMKWDWIQRFIAHQQEGEEP